MVTLPARHAKTLPNAAKASRRMSSGKEQHHNGVRLDLTPKNAIQRGKFHVNARGVRSNLSPKRVGVFAGSFDPVHAGHITFTLQAIEVSQLDRVYFMPEREPRGKKTEYYGHRVAMLSRALRPYGRMFVLETVEKQFVVRRTLAHLRQQFPNARFVFLLGSDTAKGLTAWPHVKRLLGEGELCIALRKKDTKQEMHQALDLLPIPPAGLVLLEGVEKHVSSSSIRMALASGTGAIGLLKSVYYYARREWLYLHN
ncbi:MAG: nicotinate-nucleotide adenylyltransferase [Patescibacteria group bacterium]|nr:nicotinate-nucleotide adenylyltransferase [Patescibacteria group bacterium]